MVKNVKEDNCFQQCFPDLLVVCHGVNTARDRAKDDRRYHHLD